MDGTCVDHATSAESSVNSVSVYVLRFQYDIIVEFERCSIHRPLGDFYQAILFENAQFILYHCLEQAGCA